MELKTKELVQLCNLDSHIWVGSASWIMYQGLALILVLVGLVSNAFIMVLMHLVRSHLRAHTCLLYSVAVVDTLILINYFLLRVDEILIYTNSKNESQSATSLLSSYNHQSITFVNNETQSFTNSTWNTSISHSSQVDDDLIENTASLFNSIDATGCKVYHFIVDILYTMASWLIALLSIERFNVIYFPFRNHLCSKTHEALFFVGICFLASGFSGLYIPVMMTKNKNVCAPSIDYESTYAKVNIYWSSTIVQYILPAIIIFLCNGLVLMRMHSIMGGVHSNERVVLQGLRSNKRHQNHSQDRLSKNKRRVTIILLIISTSYAILHLPLIIFMLYVDHRSNQLENINNLKNHCNEAKFIFEAHQLQNGPMVPYAGLVSCVSYVINFFVYIIWGKRYRAELSRLISSRTTSASLFAGGGNVGHFGTGRLQMLTPGASLQGGAMANHFAMQELK